jgi:Ca-activated chloride channel family protein
MSVLRPVLLLLLVVVGVTTQPALAAPAGGRVTEGTLFWGTDGQWQHRPAPMLGTDVQMRVTGIVVRATVRQEFLNPSNEWAEGVYVFPLPEDAAVDRLRMHVGGRLIEGVIQERAAAKAAYVQAKQEGRRASLVEQERPNIFTNSIANIPPGASIVVEIEYQQAVRYDGGRFRLRFPMVVGPRFIPGLAELKATDGGWSPDTDQVPDASRITPPVAHPSRGPLNPVSLRIELDPGVPLAAVESPSHQILTMELSASRYDVTLHELSVPADRDFELVWQPALGAAPAVALHTEPRGDGVFALLMVMPPAPAAFERLRTPREVVFVVDHSGSMAGASMEQAKAALTLALRRLRPTDSFNVVRFNHETHSLFGDAQPATPANVQAAERYVSDLRANGGTVMLPALWRALEGETTPGQLRQVIFLTDGAVGNEEQLFQAIAEGLGNSRLFTIGIGSAPNSHFMREAARLGRGAFTYIGSPTEVQDKMVALFKKLESPALTDVSLELTGADADVLPAPIPDLYLGEPVVVTFHAQGPPTHAVLRGRLGPRPWEQELSLHTAAPGAGLAGQWARSKIAWLLDQRRAGVDSDDVRAAVTAIALAHHLVSPYTSLVAIDLTPVRRPDANLFSHALATNLPAGWQHQEVWTMGQGATAGMLHIVLGLAALTLAAALFACRRREA